VLFSADLGFVLPDDTDDNLSRESTYQAINSNAYETDAVVDQTARSLDEASTSSHLVIIDQNVENYAAIKTAIESRTDGQWNVHVIDNGANPIASITTALSNHTDLTALHLITHGEDGRLSFGDTSIDAMSLLQQAEEISTWKHALAVDADILIYGCDIAATDEGKAMIDSLSHLTGADVAASDDATGHTTDNADWELEYRTGDVDAQSALINSVQDDFVSTLGNYLVTTTNDSGPGSLRQAIIDVNNDGGTNTITFLVGGTFSILSKLPDINETVVIDATSIPGYSGTPLAVLDGSSAGTGSALRFDGNADDSEVRGLSIFGFNGHGIWVTDVSNLTIDSNYLGTDGVVDNGLSLNAIQLDNSHNTTITNNLFQANTRDGIFASSSSQLSITDNVLRNNGDEGVLFTFDTSVDNSVLRNIFIDNASLNIDFGFEGAPPNDYGEQDADTGPNNFQNTPDHRRMKPNTLQ